MSYFSYHGRNKKLIKEGLLENYFYKDEGKNKLLLLVFKDGRTFPVKEERWIEYYHFIKKYYKEERKDEKDN